MALNDVIMQLSLFDHHPWTKCPSLESYPDTHQPLCHSASQKVKPQLSRLAQFSFRAQGPKPAGVWHKEGSQILSVRGMATLRHPSCLPKDGTANGPKCIRHHKKYEQHPTFKHNVLLKTSVAFKCTNPE